MAIIDVAYKERLVSLISPNGGELDQLLAIDKHTIIEIAIFKVVIFPRITLYQYSVLLHVHFWRNSNIYAVRTVLTSNNNYSTVLTGQRKLAVTFLFESAHRISTRIDSEREF